MASKHLSVRTDLAQLLREATEPLANSLDALLAKARAGDTRAFQRVRKRFEPQLINFVRSFVKGDEDTAHDVVQETFLIAWTKLDQIKDGKHLRPWLYRVARFKAITFLRRRGPKGVPMHSLDFAAENGGELRNRTATDPLRQAMVTEAGKPWIQAARKAVDSLPPLYVAVIRLYYDEGLTTTEVATLLKLPRTTVKMRLLRGRKLLKKMILEQMKGEEPNL